MKAENYEEKKVFMTLPSNLSSRPTSHMTTCRLKTSEAAVAFEPECTSGAM